MSAIDAKENVKHVEDSDVAIYDTEALKKIHRHGPKGVVDAAAELLAAAGAPVNYSVTERKRLLRMIDIYVCIPMCLVYFIQQVSRFRVMATDPCH